jgi:hypothetical protein
MGLGRAPETGTIALIVVTALISMLMGVFGKAAAEWLMNLILRPVRFVKETVYGWLAPRNPFSISLRSYKKHVSRSNLTRIENPVGPNLEVPLEHAFAPLKLISSATEESVDLFSQTASSRRFIVLGGPGTGKTTLMKSLVTGVLKGRAREAALKDLIPVFVVLRNLAKKGHTVEQAVVSSFADYHFPGAEKFVASALEQGKMLVILDGLDEVGASRDFVAEQIQKFCEYDAQREHPNRLIVTCRENSYRTKDLQGVIPEVVRVEPFANHHMRVFLQGWPAHKGRTAMKLYGLIQNDPQIRDICRNPLLLTILTGLYLDTDNFELPTSRERFYKDAVDELLIQRPIRRQIKQTFDADDKRQILERVSLDRLETVTPREDPEEFTQEVIRQKAAEVLRREDFDPRELIRELVEINGIIKPGTEGSYTCAHRTIQEYFAAREARRRRTTEEVVEHFGSRPEFIEVLYFYCGLVDNLPALSYVVNTFVGQRRWLEAGRCILFMKEPPDKASVERVAGELHDQVSPSVEYKAALEVLSSLAQRRAPEFEPAREFFARAVDRLAEGYGESGASALESALATSPEAAMKVVPGLLKHQSPRWRETAVQLLRDIGTDEALDQLVQLLNYADPFVRAQAGRMLAEMIRSRPHDLRTRAALLPPRTDPDIWPLEEYFPGSLAIPIAESLADSEETKSEAINHAARAVRARNGGAGRSERHFLNLWRRVPRDLALKRRKRHVGRTLALCSYATLVACLMGVAALHIWGYRTDKGLVLTLTPLRLHRIEAARLREVQERVHSITDDIRQRYRPSVTGVERFYPSNWSPEPVLPDGKDKAYETVSGWSFNNITPYDVLAESPRLGELRGFVPDDKVEDLEASLRLLQQNVPDLGGASHTFIAPSVSAAFVFIIMPVYIFVILHLILLPAGGLSSRRVRAPDLLIFYRKSIGNLLTSILKNMKNNLSGAPGSLGYLNSGRSLIVNFSLVLPFVGTWILFYTGAGKAPWLLFPLGLVAAGMIAGWFLQRLDWPRNPLLHVVNEIVPPQASTAAEQEGLGAEELDEENAREIENLLRGRW